MRSSVSGAAPSPWRSKEPQPGPARSALEALLTVLLAPACAVCDARLGEPTRGPVCTRCWHAIPYLTPPLCDRCGDPLPSPRPPSPAAEWCAGCRTRRSAITRARAVGPYDGTLREIVHLLKYHRRHTLAVRLGIAMRQCGRAVLADADCVIPVPLHARRRRARGFNQAAELAAQLDLPVIHALRRTVATRPQVELPAAERHRNVAGAFAPALNRGWRRTWPRLRGARVVLVDDVVTTGATVEACARVLRGLAVDDVRVLTLAKVANPRST